MSSRGHVLTVGGNRLPLEQVNGLRDSGLGTILVRAPGEIIYRSEIPDTENIPIEKKARRNYLATKRRQKAARLKYKDITVEQQIKERVEREEEAQKENQRPRNAESNSELDDGAIVTDQEVEELQRKRDNELCKCRWIVLQWIRQQKVTLRRAKEARIGRLLGTSDPKAMYNLYFDPSFQREFEAYIDLCLESSAFRVNSIFKDSATPEMWTFMQKFVMARTDDLHWAAYAVEHFTTVATGALYEYKLQHVNVNMDDALEEAGHTPGAVRDGVGCDYVGANWRLVSPTSKTGNVRHLPVSQQRVLAANARVLDVSVACDAREKERMAGHCCGPQKPVSSFREASFDDFARSPVLRPLLKRTALHIHPLSGMKYLAMVVHYLVYKAEHEQIHSRNLKNTGFNRKDGGWCMQDTHMNTLEIQLKRSISRIDNHAKATGVHTLPVDVLLALRPIRPFLENLYDEMLETSTPASVLDVSNAKHYDKYGQTKARFPSKHLERWVRVCCARDCRSTFIYGDGKGYGNATRDAKCRACKEFRLQRKSIYCGVSWENQCKPGKTSAKPWVASITVNRKFRHLGRFVSELDAARAYDVVALSVGRSTNL